MHFSVWSLCFSRLFLTSRTPSCVSSEGVLKYLGLDCCLGLCRAFCLSLYVVDFALLSPARALHAIASISLEMMHRWMECAKCHTVRLCRASGFWWAFTTRWGVLWVPVFHLDSSPTMGIEFKSMFAFLASTKDKSIVSRTMLGKAGADVVSNLISLLSSIESLKVSYHNVSMTQGHYFIA